MNAFFEQYNVVCSQGLSLDELWQRLVQNEIGITDLKESGIVAANFAVTIGAPYKGNFLPDVNANKIEEEYKAIISQLFLTLAPGNYPVDAIILASNINTIEQGLSSGKFSEEKCLSLITDELKNRGIEMSLDLEIICLYNTCISGLSCLEIASNFLKAGKKQVLVVTLEPRLRQWGLMPLDFLNMLSRTTDIQRSSIPFSVDRMGFVKGDGCAVAILGKESRHSLGIQLRETVSVNDVYRLTDPSESGEGLEQSINRALQKSLISSSEIDYVSAHAAGTIKYDKIEASVIERCLAKNSGYIVGALKSQIGHTNISSGLIAAIVSAECLRRQIVLPVLNLKPDPEITLQNFILKAQHKSIRNALVNASGIGGNNAAAVLSII